MNIVANLVTNTMASYDSTCVICGEEMATNHHLFVPISLFYAFYRLQGKVMFSEASVSHFVHIPECRPPERRPLCSRHLVVATAAVRTHPTGMHSCYVSVYVYVSRHLYTLIWFNMCHRSSVKCLLAPCG